MNLTDRVLDRVIALAMRTPYFHLHHADGTLYMERYWIVPGYVEGEHPAGSDRWIVKLLHHFGVAIRLHIIHTPDLDREMHDHPWTFLSVVLRRWYVEARPMMPERADFVDLLRPLPVEVTEGVPLTPDMVMLLANPPVMIYKGEPFETTRRERGSWALRRFYHRHRITAVAPGGVVTLFITFRKRQAWGFFTPRGKMWWWVFESVHNSEPLQ